MTVRAIIGCILFSIAGILLVIVFSRCMGFSQVVTVALVLLVCVVIFGFGFWYFQNTASGQRALIDEQSELQNGLEREITVYTANGDVLAHYEGKIDIEDNDGGYVIFDFEGKRYMYYNCFVESIAKY